MAQSEERTNSRIPEFASREEAAEWFDTHDMADYQDEFKTVRMRLANNLSEGITIRLDPETLVALRTVAKRKGHRPRLRSRACGSRSGCKARSTPHQPRISPSQPPGWPPPPC